MKDFGRWFNDFKLPVSEPAEVELPEGLWEANGGYEAQCRSCERYYEIYCGPEEFDQDYSYCGSGPHCCP